MPLKKLANHCLIKMKEKVVISLGNNNFSNLQVTQLILTNFEPTISKSLPIYLQKDNCHRKWFNCIIYNWHLGNKVSTHRMMVGGRIEFYQINLVQIIKNLKWANTEISNLKLFSRIGSILSHLHLTIEELHRLYLSNQRSLKRVSQWWLVNYKLSQLEDKICRRVAGNFKRAETNALRLVKNRVLAIKIAVINT